MDAPPNDSLRAQLADKSGEELREILTGYGVSEIDVEVSDRRLIRMIEKCAAGYPAENESAPRYDVLQLGITFDRETLYRRISERLDARIKDGMIDEVREVLRLGATPEFLEKLGLEYRYTYRYISGQYSSFDEYRAELYKEICHFAKRQMTWFRKEKSIVWLDTDGNIFEQARELIDEFKEN